MRTIENRTRVQLKNILFSTDFSPASQAALPYAAELSRLYGAKLHVLHVRPQDTYGMDPPVGSAAVPERTEQHARQQMQRLIDSVPDLEPRVLIRSGEVWPALEKVIATENIDLIVLGTRGRTGLERVFLGSVAETILCGASCPVLTIGPHCAEHPERTAAFRRILFATKFNDGSLSAMPYAFSLAQENEGDLMLLHVVEESAEPGIFRSCQLTDLGRRMLREFVPADEQLWCRPMFLVQEGSPAETIMATAERKAADLIVVGLDCAAGSHLRLPFTTAHKVISHASCPVLTVRAREAAHSASDKRTAAAVRLAHG